MKIIKLESDDMFRAQVGRYGLSFVPNLKTGINTLSYDMHWVMSDGMFNSFICLRKDCPICDYAKALASEEARQWQPKKRVLINVWEGESFRVKVWDASAWLIQKGFGSTGFSSSGGTFDSRLWDPSKYGIALALDVRRRGPYPEYNFTKSLRRFEIPLSILDQARDLRDLITVPTVDKVVESLEDFLSSGLRVEVQRTESVGEVAELVRQTRRPKSNIFVDVSKRPTKNKPKYQEPEPYKRVKRIIIMEDD